MNCLCRPSTTLCIRIVLLDDTEFLYEIKDDLPGQCLLDVVFSRLNLIETAYFGLRYLDEENQTHWIDPVTRLCRQFLKPIEKTYDLYFGTKFYAADPTKLIEEITRYQLFLQVKQDILQGRLPVRFELAAELGAYVVQSELGDYDSRRNLPGYVSEFRLVENQTRDLENRVSEIHQHLKGMSPAQAEFNYLDKIKWHDMYGVDLHPVLGEDNVEYYLGLTPSGIVVLKNKSTVAYYYWPRIAKVYYKGRYFMLRVCDKNNGASTYGFETPHKTSCRYLWRCCVEHHSFFRLIQVPPMQQDGSTDFFSLGSRFRYSGRTETQAVRDAIENGRIPPVFHRTQSSRRHPRRHLEVTQQGDETDNSNNQEIKSVSIPQPTDEIHYRYGSHCSLPTSVSFRYRKKNGDRQKSPDSTASTRSAPWTRNQQKGLFGIVASPSSERSRISQRNSNQPVSHRLRSSSVESQSSNESRYRRFRHLSKRASDNDSELSSRSNRSHNSHRKHRRHRSRYSRNDSGSENESTRNRSSSGHRKSTGVLNLIDSNCQWQELQRRQLEVSTVGSVQEASVMKSSTAISKYRKSNDSDSVGSSHHKGRKPKKNRSPTDHDRSRIWSSELAKHLQFDLVDTTGMTDDQLKEIPYTVVETTSKRPTKPNSLKVHKTNINDRVDRIRGGSQENNINGSIRSASTLSSRESEKNLGLVRIMSNLSVGLSPSASSLGPLDASPLQASHEHTDSGLGAEQDYAYFSERSSDSTKYGTNKSSGASVTSVNQHRAPNLTLSTVPSSESVSNRKPPIIPNYHHNQKAQTAPVHINCNNRLINNTMFHNNQYTFSLNGYGDGYLEPRPLSSTSLYDECVMENRSSKSDIGIPVCRNNKNRTVASRKSTNPSHSLLPNGSRRSEVAVNVHRLKPPSTKSDYFLFCHSSSPPLKFIASHSKHNPTHLAYHSDTDNVKFCNREKMDKLMYEQVHSSDVKNSKIKSVSSEHCLSSLKNAIVLNPLNLQPPMFRKKVHNNSQFNNISQHPATNKCNKIESSTNNANLSKKGPLIYLRSMSNEYIHGNESHLRDQANSLIGEMCTDL